MCEPPVGERSFLAAFADALSLVVEDPELEAALQGIEFTDDDTNEQAFGRRAFALLLDNIVSQISASTFTLAYFEGTLRPLIYDVVGVRLSATAWAKIDAFLDVLSLGLDPGRAPLAPLQPMLDCMLDRDPTHDVAG